MRRLFALFIRTPVTFYKDLEFSKHVVDHVTDWMFSLSGCWNFMRALASTFSNPSNLFIAAQTYINKALFTNVFDSLADILMLEFIDQTTDMPPPYTAPPPPNTHKAQVPLYSAADSRPSFFLPGSKKRCSRRKYVTWTTWYSYTSSRMCIVHDQPQAAA